MKKIHSYLLAVAALFVFVPGLNAQTIEEEIGPLEFPGDTSGFAEEANIGFKKNISKPVDGTYWLKLEAYATGSGTQTSKAVPSDVILVLDLSSSMDDPYEGYTDRLDALQVATKKFVDSIYQNAVDALAQDPQYPGNRIAIITYSGSTQVYLESGGWVTVDATGRDFLKDDVIDEFDLTGHSGTRPEYGLKMAIDELLSGTTDDDSARDGASVSVVMFTDGYPVQSQTDPGEGSGNTRFNYGYANDAIYYAHQIKADYKAKLFTVGLITPVAQANNWEYRNYRRVQYLMDLLSSNYPDSSIDQLGNTNTWVVADNSLGAITVEGLTPGTKDNTGNYFQLVTEDTDLSDIFDTIASQSGGSPAETFTEESQAVDIVSSSFLLDGANASDIKVFTAPYLFNSETGELFFGTETLAPNSTDTYDDYEVVDGNKVLVKADKDVDDAIMEAGGITVNGNEITVTGFDYADNWCGPVKEGTTTVDAQGHKIIIMIPIVTNPDAVGGPNVATNGPGSGIKDKNGDMLVKFDPPAVSLPINVQIQTTGLSEGESAKYSIKRRVGTGEWEYVTTVFVTRHKGQGDPSVYLKGLPSRGDEGNYQYIIIDDDWDWTYTLDNVSGTRTDGETEPYGPDEDIYTDNFAVNPIIFNVSKNNGISPKVRYSESKASNNFETQEAGYDDYKNNGRTVITVTSD
jgi:hypothetical protein